MDLKALENPRRSIKEYRTVGCTKDVGKGKRIIIVDCITENGPVPGALWIFSAGSKSQKEKQEISFKETAVNIEKAKEIVHAIKEQGSGLKMCHLPLRLGQQRESPRQMSHLRNQKK